MFDDFELSTSIATGCSTISHNVMYSCGLNDPEIGVIFTMEMTACGVKVPDSAETAELIGICYEVPIGDSQLFSS